MPGSAHLLCYFLTLLQYTILYLRSFPLLGNGQCIKKVVSSPTYYIRTLAAPQDLNYCDPWHI